MFDISILFMVVSYIAYFYVLTLHKYSHMMIFGILGNFAASIYLVLNDALSGGVVCIVGCVASIMQLYFNSYKKEVSSKLKNSVAIAFAVIAVSILYQKPSDLLPCIGFSLNRVLEAQNSVLCVRFGFLFATILWAIYAALNQLYFMAVIEMSISVYTLFCLMKFNKPANQATVMSS